MAGKVYQYLLFILHDWSPRACGIFFFFSSFYAENHRKLLSWSYSAWEFRSTVDNEVQNNHYIVEVFSSINNGGVSRKDIFSGTWKGKVYFFLKKLFSHRNFLLIWQWRATLVSCPAASCLTPTFSLKIDGKCVAGQIYTSQNASNLKKKRKLMLV